MQKVYLTFCLLTWILHASGQYYIRGEVKDEKNQPIQNVKIFMPLTRSIFYSGISGGFGIPSTNLFDSLILSSEGFETKALRVKSDVYQEITLKMLSTNVSTKKPKLVSLTMGSEGHIYPTAYYRDESYSNLVENEFIKSNINNSTGFAMRIDKASYSNIRRFINQNSKVPPDAVRIDEMLNYFNFNYKEPEGKNVFNIESKITDCPWNKANRLLFLNLSGKKLNLEKVPPSNFVFLIDVSGSMDLPNRLPLLKESFQLLVKNLREKDTVSIVVYGGTVGIWLQPTSGSEKQKIIKSIEELTAAGDTPGEAAIRSAYKLAENTFIKGGNNRIILATDGDFNVGQKTEKELEELISKERQSGVYLTCLGVGMGNYKDSKIEVLAKKGNGNFAYIDDIREAEKILVTEFTQTLYSIANDVYFTLQFNPGVVKEYRLIGYDNKKNILSQQGDELEGGEIGAGTSNTAVFEIIPLPGDTLQHLEQNIAKLTMHYKLPHDTTEQLLKYDCLNNYSSFNSLCKNLQFATAVCMFGLKLRESGYFPSDIDWTDIKAIALKAAMKDDYLQNEFVGLLDKTKIIYYEKKRKKRK
ncbi:MAG TPA: von Willebrand factor type A domain-containing protein [Chitinophagaceae bacterium]|nr:von Willebrand factor type A domain-containing protein [Chitinophagaceae bacterium]